MNKKDDIRTLFVIIAVCAICIIIGLIFSFKSNSDKLVIVNDYNQFFSNINYVNDYINYIINNDSTAVYNLLDKNYIEDNGITIDNVLSNVGNYSFGTSLNVTSMQYVKIDDNFIYYVNGNIYVNTYTNRELIDDNFSIFVIIDENNSNYSLYPVNDDDYKDVINSIWRVNIENNDHNDIEEYGIVNKEQICVIYLSDFINNIFNNINDSYELLSDDMKNIYTSSNSYSSYITNNIGLISTVADKCKLDEYDDKRVYTVIDSKENTYVFTEESIMNYKVDFYFKKSK